MVPLRPSYWASLDATNQREFASLVTERGLYVLTEQPSDGKLRIEHVGKDAA